MKNKMTMRKKVLLSLIGIISLSLIIYEILVYVNNPNDLILQVISLVRLSSVVLFIVIPLFLTITRKVPFYTFIYSFSFEAGFDSTMQSLYLWLGG